MVKMKKCLILFICSVCFEGCIWLNRKDKLEYLVDDFKNSKEIGSMLILQNRIYIRKTNRERLNSNCIDYIVFNNGYFEMSGVCDPSQKLFNKVSESTDDRIWGRATIGTYAVDSNEVTLVQSKTYRITEVKNRFGSLWNHYTNEMKGAVEPDSIINLQVTQHNPIIRTKARDTNTYTYYATPYTYKLDTAHVRSQLERRNR